MGPLLAFVKEKRCVFYDVRTKAEETVNYPNILVIYEKNREYTISHVAEKYRTHGVATFTR
jgi:hypothetical protein